MSTSIGSALVSVQDHGILKFPDEIICEILKHLNIQAALACRITSIRIKNIVDYYPNYINRLELKKFIDQIANTLPETQDKQKKLLFDLRSSLERRIPDISIEAYFKSIKRRLVAILSKLPSDEIPFRISTPTFFQSTFKLTKCCSEIFYITISATRMEWVSMASYLISLVQLLPYPDDVSIAKEAIDTLPATSHKDLWKSQIK